jgi:iron complex outermembrane receptor protein
MAIWQSAPAQSDAPASNESQSTAAARKVEEVIVTAQRRTESLQDVPLSVTVLTGDELVASGVRSTSDLTLVVPGLLYGRSTNFSQPAIRGIGTRNASSGDEPNVATYIDGVYQPDSIGTPMELSDVQSIQVLKGPQGTLYGRNATGGAIIITTRRPDFAPSASVSASGGRFGYYKFSGFLTGPLLGDDVAGSLSAVTFGNDGYVRNIARDNTTGKDRGTAVRGKLLWVASDDLSFQLNGFYSDSFNNVLTSSYALNGNAQSRGLVASPVLNPTQLPVSQVVADRPYTTATGLDPETQVYQSVGDAHMDWDLGWASLSALASAGRTKVSNLSLTDVSPFLLSRTEYDSINRSYNQEVVLTSPGDQRVTWIAGLTGFQSSNAFSPLVSTSRNTTTGVATPSRTFYGQDADALAGFGEVTWQALERLYLTGGMRYSWDRKSAFNQTNANPRVSATSDFYNFAPRGVIRYEWSPSTSTYFSYGEGYKSGNFNATSAAGVIVASTGRSAAVDPETIKSYELGLKTEFGIVRADFAAFHYDYSDLQVSAAVIDPSTGASLTNLQNAGAAEVNGFEASIVVQPTSSLSLNFSTELMKAIVHGFPNAVAPVPRTNLANCAPGGVPTLTGNVTCTLDVGGNDLIRAPRYTYSVGGSYELPLAGGDLTLNANAFFSAKYYADLPNQVVQPSYHVVNASATWRAPGRHAYVTVFGNNLTDEVYAVGHLVSNFITATQAAKPRWYGVTIGYDF